MRLNFSKKGHSQFTKRMSAIDCKAVLYHHECLWWCPSLAVRREARDASITVCTGRQHLTTPKWNVQKALFCSYCRNRTALLRQRVDLRISDNVQSGQQHRGVSTRDTEDILQRAGNHSVHLFVIIMRNHKTLSSSQPYHKTFEQSRRKREKVTSRLVAVYTVEEASRM